MKGYAKAFKFTEEQQNEIGRVLERYRNATSMTGRRGAEENALQVFGEIVEEIKDEAVEIAASAALRIDPRAHTEVMRTIREVPIEDPLAIAL